MRLELAIYPVHRIESGSETDWSSGVLTYDPVALTDLICQDRRIRAVKIEAIQPGDAARLINVHDILEPRIKVDGPGQTYPGICGRQITTVGIGCVDY